MAQENHRRKSQPTNTRWTIGLRIFYNNSTTINPKDDGPGQLDQWSSPVTDHRFGYQQRRKRKTWPFHSYGRIGPKQKTTTKKNNQSQKGNLRTSILGHGNAIIIIMAKSKATPQFGVAANVCPIFPPVAIKVDRVAHFRFFPHLWSVNTVVIMAPTFRHIQ